MSTTLILIGAFVGTFGLGFLFGTLFCAAMTGTKLDHLQMENIRLKQRKEPAE